MNFRRPITAILFQNIVVKVRSFSSTTSSTTSATKSKAFLPKYYDDIPLAKKAMGYIDASPDPFHAVQSSIDMFLKPAGFQEIQDDCNFQDCVKPAGKYYFTRNKSTIVAFAVGKQYKQGNGFKIIGGHTDSPNIKVKTRSKKRSSATGCIQLSVECYGGGLWHTWFDRDLGISGRVLVRDADTGKIDQKLIKIDRPIVRISNLAIHLQSPKQREAFQINKEDHLSPILAMEAEKALTTGKNNDGTDTNTSTNNDKDGWVEYQEPLLLDLI